MKKNGTIIAVILSIVSLCCSAVCLGMVLGQKNAANAPEADTGKNVQYVMYVGTNDKDTYKMEMSQEEARNIVDQVCLQFFEGYTLQDAIGAWTDETGTITHEYTLVCYFDSTDKATVYKAADEVLKALNQNTVLIEENEIKMDYYSGK